MSEQMPPDWAIERACTASGHSKHHRDSAKAQPKQNPTIIAFAHYIAQHEDAPVDPLQECLRETYGAAAPESVSAFRAALGKHGLEIREAAQ
ncbi:hypothetical protein [Novosphingobium sp. Leaf2]|uniref:hypothetical protein n=1 Tax=Novosphingobium sp. Leaf2 TaxID=1735670 RepID=UPI000713A5DD|nr:hypothetical protein [Novosphingobium sp. Leaf2]KQM18405.1 hypothetical protein ASE49_09345 [Novosphingobium sp. Leaf2]